MRNEPLSYHRAGVNIAAADNAKRQMARSLETSDERVMNRIGAFATLVDGRFPEYQHPILVLKTEEPGSKQKLALQHGRYRSICQDMIHHLVNDIIVMGAMPVSVQDCIVCGKLETDVVTELVDGMAAACREQGCVLTGGETSEQPGVLDPGAYILTSSIIGVVEKAHILDGSRITEGDVAIAVASNGLHTNGYSLVRALLERDPLLAGAMVANRTFLDAVLEPHRCYYRPFQSLYRQPELRGMAHITGGGIAGNLNRILPEGLNARVDLSHLHLLPVFNLIRMRGAVKDEEMLRTFNLGVGMVLVAKPSAADFIQRSLQDHDLESNLIGEIVPGDRQVEFTGSLRWERAPV